MRSGPAVNYGEFIEVSKGTSNFWCFHRNLLRIVQEIASDNVDSSSERNDYCILLDNVIAADINISRITAEIDENQLRIANLTIEAANILDDVVPKLENEKKLHASAKLVIYPYFGYRVNFFH